MSRNKGNKSYIFLILSLAIYLVLKMQRGFTVSEVEGGVWNAIQVMYVVLGLFVLCSNERSYLSFSFVRHYLTFFIYIWVLSFFVIAFKSFSVTDMFRLLMVPYGVMCMLPFYYVGLKTDIKKYPLILYSAFIIISYILFTSLGQYYTIANSDYGALADLYYILGLLPIIFIYTPQKFRIIPFLIACAAVMMSAKRTGFLALGCIMVLYFLSSDSGNKSLIKRLIIFSIVCVASFFIIDNLTDTYGLTMLERLQSIEEDGGSGRFDMWNIIINAIDNDSSFIEILVGHGYHSSFKLVDGHVHNDFLEIFYDYGIIAFVLYVLFYASIIKECVKMYKRKFQYAKEFMVAIIISLFLAMFSWYAIECTHITCCSACIGLILAEWYKYQHEKNRLG